MSLILVKQKYYRFSGESKRISAIVWGEGLSYEEEYPRWGTSNISIANISGEVVSGYTNTWGGETQRFIVTADKAVIIKGLSPGRITLSASIGPYRRAVTDQTDNSNRQRLKKFGASKKVLQIVANQRS